MSIKIVDIIIERRGKILLTKKGDFWIVPGAAIKDGETELQCLDRVVAGEINDQVSTIFQKLDETVKGHSPVRHCDVEVSIYVGDVSTRKMSDIKDCNAHWFARESISAIRTSNITKDVLDCYFRCSVDGSGPQHGQSLHGSQPIEQGFVTVSLESASSRLRWARPKDDTVRL